MSSRVSDIPLSLYLHFPWCLSKCPYCDFNSYPFSQSGIARQELMAAYVKRLLEDLSFEAKRYQGGELVSIYFGGGTPSLFEVAYFEIILAEIKSKFKVLEGTEITIELNPGTITGEKIKELKELGINRFSIGAQSFSDLALKRLSRIHNSDQIIRLVGDIRDLGIINFNLDLMYALPGQSIKEALLDVKQALGLEPAHVSWYELTLSDRQSSWIFKEAIASEEELDQLERLTKQLFNKSGYDRYELTAYSNSGLNCLHNLNYWQYGDYVAIGAGAHGKITYEGHQIERYKKKSNPKDYLKKGSILIETSEVVAKERVVVEFMLNAMRLYCPIEAELFKSRTGVELVTFKEVLLLAQSKGLIKLFIENNADIIKLETTEHGKRFLDDLLELFV
jgi:putative oxygen-independent coproporphyrinogen III oxidase